jgi:hypothetical protein
MKRAVLFLSAALAACGGSSSSGGPDASPDATPGGPPDFGTPAKTWTYVPVAGTQCMNKSSTGIVVNPGTSGDLVIYMEGGGACFNTSTCLSVAHPNGFGPNDAASVGTTYTDGIFDRSDAKNPLKDATYVFVPYCTGDVHAGSNPSGFGGRTQVGYENVGKDLDYIVPKSTPVSRVILTGSSAGGFGALFNYDRTATAFGQTPVVLLDDSGPPLSDTYMTPCLQTLVRNDWNLAAALPSDCAACTGADGGGLGNAATYLADKYKNRRMALITSTRDGIIRSFFGFGYPTCQTGGNPIPETDYATGIAMLRDTTLTGHDNFKVWSIDSDLHVWLVGRGALSTEVSHNVTLGDWITQMLGGASPWDSVAP